jgi:spore maturation protein CgeB
MNDHKIAFIMCSNNETYLQECFTYLSLLNIPEGFAIDTLVIPDAKSMCAGYNEGMNSTDAKYKIYLHQDTFIRHRDFLVDIVRIFASDPGIGMIGMIGAPKLDQSGVMWDDKRVGHFYRLEQMKANSDSVNIDILRTGLAEVEVVDGLLIVTQYDLPWREDLFDGWDFYDVSQCLEFRLRGYRIVVPGQEKSWYIHDCGNPKLGDAYEHYRQKLRAAYSEFFPPQKRFLCCTTDIVNSSHIPWGLLELGHYVAVEDNKVHIQNYEEQDKDDFAERLKLHRCDYVITFDLSPEIAQACHEVGVPYIAWAYDSPLKELNGWFAEYPTTYAFAMDKKEMERMKAEGKKHAHLNYMHLAGNTTRMQGLVITKEDREKFSHEVSMVGNLYDQGHYPGFLRRLFAADMPREEKDKLRAEMDGYIERFAGDWRRDSSVFDCMPETLVEFLTAVTTDALASFNFPNRRYYETMYAREITHRDRVRVLRELAKHWDVHLYTKRKRGVPKNVTVHGPIDPYVGAPKVFHLSKINLNISLRSIETGTPLRVFDVMSVGGFMLSNYQRELEDLFVVDKEIVLYESLEEMKEKIAYYLAHEDERKKIALAGWEKVKKHYSYPRVLEKMIAIVDKEIAEGKL